MNNRKKPSAFWIFLLTLIVLLSTASVVGLVFADKILEDYEKTRPLAAVKHLFSTLSEKSLAPLLAVSEFETDEFNTLADCEKWLSDKYESRFSEVTFLQSTERLGRDLVKFNTFLDGERIGYIIMEKTERLSEYGFAYWSAVETNAVEYPFSYEITVPYGTEIIVNGMALDKDYLTKTEILDDFPSFAGLEQPKTETYSFGSFIFEPEITVSLENATLEQVSGDNFTRLYQRGDDRFSVISETAKKALSQYIMTVSLDDDLAKYLSFLAVNTEYYNRIVNYHDGWSMYQPEFESTVVENFKYGFYREYSDTQAIMDVSFDFTITSKYAEQNYPASFRIYFVKIDDTWLIAEMVNN